MIKNDLLLRVAHGQPVERPPIWIMRQAGRYMREYREVRSQAGSFKAMIEHPEWAAEVTMQPVELIGVDAAIIFSDILVLPQALGLDYYMVPGKGPVFDQPIRKIQDIDQLRSVEWATNLDDTYKALSLVRKTLNDSVPLIGFAGAPWTIFCYMVEGEGSKTFSHAKRWLYAEPQAAHKLLEKITKGTIHYLKGQISAGAQIVKIFDSWAGILSPEAFYEFALPYIKQICEEIQEVPKIVFSKGAYYAFKELAKLDCHIIALDWQTSPEYVMPHMDGKALQGNLDPCVLYADPETIRKYTINMMGKFPPQKHVVNLGHGIYPDISPDHVRIFVETVKSYYY